MREQTISICVPLLWQYCMQAAHNARAQKMKELEQAKLSSNV